MELKMVKNSMKMTISVIFVADTTRLLTQILLTYTTGRTVQCYIAAKNANKLLKFKIIHSISCMSANTVASTKSTPSASCL